MRHRCDRGRVRTCRETDGRDRDVLVDGAAIVELEASTAGKARAGTGMYRAPRPLRLLLSRRRRNRGRRACRRRPRAGLSVARVNSTSKWPGHLVDDWATL